MTFKAFLLNVLALISIIWVSGQDSDKTIPKGEIKGPYLLHSEIYPGTERNYWVYVPAQYKADKPTCSIIVQDGLGRANGWRLPEVMDSLIATGDIPVMIGIFVDHGKVPADAEDMYPRFNRSFEYDAMGDRYARFLLEELIPEVSESYNLSANPNDRCLAGASSGAICAFNAAWERPDAFGRVLSTIGTYVGLRGGDEFPTLVRKTEPKPLRVFLEDGTGDLNVYAGDWWVANQDMWSSLTWAGYETHHIWGEEGHNSKGARKIMPEAMKWLWEGYPAKVSSHPDQYKGMKLTVVDEPWKKAGNISLKAAKLAVNAKGEIFLTAEEDKNIYKLNEKGEFEVVKKLDFTPGGIAFGPGDVLYISSPEKGGIWYLDKNGSLTSLAKNIKASDMVVNNRGIFFSESNGNIGYYLFKGGKINRQSLPGNPRGVSLTADQTFLNVTAEHQVFGYSLKINQDGSLTEMQPYTHYHIPYGQPFPAASGMTVDTENRTYTATAMGVQVSDQIGKVHFIFSNPGKTCSEVIFGGKDFDLLYIISDGKVFSRKIDAKGAPAFANPVTPGKPRL